MPRLRVVGYSHTEKSGGALHDALQHFVVVVFEMAVYSEACAQRGGEQSAAGGRSYKGEGCQCELYALGARAFVEEDVDAVVFHRGIEILLYYGVQAVYLIDEEHIVGLEAHEDACQVAGLVEHGAGGHLEAYAELIGHDVRQRGLPQSGRAVEQGVVEGLAAQTGGLHEYAQVGYDLLLAAEVVERQRAQRFLYIFFGVAWLLPADIEIFFFHVAKLQNPRESLSIIAHSYFFKCNFTPQSVFLR